MSELTPPSAAAVAAPSSVPVDARGVDVDALFRNAFQEAPTASVVTSPGGAIVAANTAFCQLVGVEEAQLRQVTFAELSHPEDRARVESARRALVSGQRRQMRLELRYLHPDGPPVWVRQDLTRVEDITGRLLYLLSQVEDMTTWRQVLTDAARQQELLAMAQRVATAANASPDTAPVVTTTIGEVCAVTGWVAGRLWTSPALGTWTAGPWLLPSGRRRGRSRGSDWQPEPPLPLQVAPTHDLVWTPTPGGGARVGVPIVRDGRPVALLEFASDHDSAPDPALAAALHTVGCQVGHVFERESARAALQASEERARLVIERANDAYVESDEQNCITGWNRQAELTFGWSAQEVMGRLLPDVLIPPAQRAAHAAGFARMLDSGRSQLDGGRLELTALHRDGREFPIELSLSARLESGGWRIHAFLHDISGRVEAERRIAQQSAFLDTVLNRLVDGVAACDAEGRLVLVNDSLSKRLGLTAGGQAPQQWRDGLLMLAEDGTPIPWDNSPLYRAFKGETVRNQRILEGPNRGSLRHLVVHAEPLQDDAGRPLGAVATYHDITEQSRAALVLSRHVRADRVTGLPNAMSLREHLDLAALEPRLARLVVLSVDDYRSTVAAAGQQAGDELLREVGARLGRMVRGSDVVAHLEADQFAVLVEDGEPRNVATVAERVLRAFVAPWTVGGDRHFISLSAGLAAGVADVALLRHAELALQHAREQGRGRLEVYRPVMESALRDERTQKDDLERALQAGQFSLRYQPQVDLRTGTVRGVEALVRWQHPTRGLVRPDDFIPLAERTGLIVPLGRWVLNEALSQLRAWREAGLPELHMAVNLSSAQLDERLLGEVAAALALSGVPAGLLELEVTETAAVRPDSDALAVLQALDDLGVTLSIDDFGTGYSMLGQLRSFPFRQLKIDKSFVQDLGEDGQAPLVVAMMTMARSLGLQVVAEGVETTEQLSFLLAEDCALAQGYLFSRPVEPAEIVRMMRTSDPLPGFATVVRRSTWAGPQPRLLRSPQDLEKMVRPLLEQVERVTGLESTYLTRVADGVQEILVARNTGDMEVPEGLQLPWSSSLCSVALVDGPAIVPHVPTAFPEVRAAAALGIQTYVGVPVRTPDGVLYGTLCGAGAGAGGAMPDGPVLELLTLYADLLGERISRDGLEAADEQRRRLRRQEQDQRALFLSEAELRIRQPLTVLQGWSGTLLRHGDEMSPAARTQGLEALAGSAAAVAGHLDRLLDEARGEVLRQALELAPVALRALLDPLLEQSIRPEGGSSPDVQVLVDRLAVDKVLADVLAVAGRHGGRPGVAAHVLGDAVEVRVQAPGAGLAAELDPFAPFSGDPGVAEPPSLFVARALAEAMGGTVAVGTRRGEELAVSVWLPIAAPARP